jgi:glutaconate CoA-transferase subunit A
MMDITVPPERRASKLISIEAAVGTVLSGMSVAVGGIHSNNSPMALVREVVRQHPDNLRLIPNVSAGLPADLLIGAGLVKHVLACYVGLEDLGLARNFRRAAEDGSIEIEEADEPYFIGGLAAGATDQPFYVMPKGHGALSDAQLNPLFRQVIDPYTGDEVYVTPAIQPDVALIHVGQADLFGNCRCLGSETQDYLLARAASHVIVSAEEIVSPYDIVTAPKSTTIPYFMVDAVVHCPYGAHPNSCHGVYFHDEATLYEYRDLAIETYLDKYVHSNDHWSYLDKFGVKRLMALRQNEFWTRAMQQDNGEEGR